MPLNARDRDREQARKNGEKRNPNVYEGPGEKGAGSSKLPRGEASISSLLGLRETRGGEATGRDKLSEMHSGACDHGMQDDNTQRHALTEGVMSRAAGKTTEPGHNRTCNGANQKIAASGQFRAGDEDVGGERQGGDYPVRGVGAEDNTADDGAEGSERQGGGYSVKGDGAEGSAVAPGQARGDGDGGGKLVAVAARRGALPGGLKPR